MYKSPVKISITAAKAFFKRFRTLSENILEGGDLLMAKRKGGVRYIFTAYITRPNGIRVYASEYGLKAFCIPVRDKNR